MGRTRPKRWPGQFAGWTTLWLAWVGLSRHNHPTLRLNLIACGLLVSTFAAAVYLNHRWLIPRHLQTGRPVAYAVALVVALACFSMLCTMAIHVVYDWLWGPDPARFGFWTNFGLEFGLTAFHVGIIAAGARTIRRVPAGRRPEAGGGDPAPPASSRRLTPSG